MARSFAAGGRGGGKDSCKGGRKEQVVSIHPMASTLASKREEEEEEHISVTFKERITIHLWEGGGGGGDLPLTQRVYLTDLAN